MDDAQTQGQANRGRRVVTAGLSLVVLVSLAYAATQLDLSDLTFTFGPAPFAAMLACFVFMALFETLRLSALARFKSSPWTAALGINAAAMALVQAPFGIIGAEAYRANAYIRRGEVLADVLAAILVARALGLATMLVLIAFAAGFLTDQFPSGVKTAAAFCAALGFVAISMAPMALRRWGALGGSGRLARFFTAIAALSVFQLALAVFWSFLVVLTRALAVWFCGQAIGYEISFAFAVFASAAGLFIAIIPFLSGVVGVREGGIAGLLLLAGVPLPAGVLIGFALRLGAVAGGLLGMMISQLMKRLGAS